MVGQGDCDWHYESRGSIGVAACATACEAEALCEQFTYGTTRGCRITKCGTNPGPNGVPAATECPSVGQCPLATGNNGDAYKMATFGYGAHLVRDLCGCTGSGNQMSCNTGGNRYCASNQACVTDTSETFPHGDDPHGDWGTLCRRIIATRAELNTAVTAYNSNAASATTTYGPISTWHVSAVTDMSALFANMEWFNADISGWDTSSVTTMYQMFRVRSARALCAQP